MNSKASIRIAVIKTDGIGDAVLASPFLFELRKNYKDAHITGILSPGGEQILGDIGVFDEVIVHDAMWLKYKKTFFLTRWLSAMSLLFKINKARYDIVIGLRWQDRLTSLILSLCNAKDKYGYNTAGMGFGINHKIPILGHDSHVIDRNMEVLRQMLPGKNFGIKLGVSICRDAASASAKATADKCCVSQEENCRDRACSVSDAGDTASCVSTKTCLNTKSRYIVIHPVSGCPAKDWAIEKYAQLAKKLAQKMPVYIIGTAADAGIKTISGKNIHNTAGDLSIRGIATLVKGASLVIGNDSAAVHIASAFNVKSLTLFSGSALHEEWGAYGKNSFILTKDVICRECELAVCSKQVHECMEFDTEEVEKLAFKILNGKQKKKLVLISAASYEKHQEMMKFREKILFAEQARVSGEPTYSVDEAEKILKKKLHNARRKRNY